MAVGLVDQGCAQRGGVLAALKYYRSCLVVYDEAFVGAVVGGFDQDRDGEAREDDAEDFEAESVRDRECGIVLEPYVVG